MVQDSSGAVIPGAPVVLRNVDTNVNRTSPTNEVGDYSFVDFLPSRYTLEISKVGFQTQQQAMFTLNVNQTTTYNFTLPVGTASLSGRSGRSTCTTWPFSFAS